MRNKRYCNISQIKYIITADTPLKETSRDRPKSSPYPRLKNSKKTSKCKYSLLQYSKIEKFRNCQHFCRSWKGDPSEKKFSKKISQCRETEKGTLWDFKHPICCKISKKLKGGPFGEKKILGKKVSVPKKTVRGTLWDFPTSILSQNRKKIEGGPFGEIFFFEKKSRSAKKNERGDPLVSPGMVCYAEKQENPFWFSSLGQIAQFGAIIFCRTFKNYFGQFVWIEKKRKATITVAFHFMKRRLKIRHPPASTAWQRSKKHWISSHYENRPLRGSVLFLL